ncbi:hypothetical protein AAFF_G00287880 [Aldrovandia affinis]|uniref:M-phase phosphoprotein 8 n=1 Tax=Aldrovandia affinis TaxID=143900 RepID=A0AAD7WS05_9TELE|nr:hypothetical protein AAFF_G00287880 [Aldrovandia affinis]
MATPPAKALPPAMAPPPTMARPGTPRTPVTPSGGRARARSRRPSSSATAGAAPREDEARPEGGARGKDPAPASTSTSSLRPARQEDAVEGKEQPASTNLFEKFLLNCEAKDRVHRRQTVHPALVDQSKTAVLKAAGKQEKRGKPPKETPGPRSEQDRTEKAKREAKGPETSRSKQSPPTQETEERLERRESTDGLADRRGKTDGQAERGRTEETRDKREGPKEKREEPQDKTEELLNKREELLNKREELLNKREGPRDKREGPRDKREGLLKKREGPKEKRGEPMERREESLDKTEGPQKREETRDKREELLKKREELLKKREELLNKREEQLKKRERPRDKKEEPLDKREELLKKRDELQDKREEPLDRREELLEKREGSMERSEESHDKREGPHGKWEELHEKRAEPPERREEPEEGCGSQCESRTADVPSPEVVDEDPQDRTPDRGQATLDLGVDLKLEWMTLEDFEKHLNGENEILSAAPISPSELRDAVRTGNYVVVKLALASTEEYNLDQEDSSGMSLAMLAAAGGQDDILRQLIKKGVKVNGRQKNGTTALMHAAEKNFLTTSAILLEVGAFVNAQTLTGETALMKACKRGNADVVRLLLEYGADCNILSKHHNNALHFAKLSNNMAVYDYVKDHMNTLSSVAEETIRAYFETRLALLEPVFPLACHRLCEGPDFSLDFNYKPPPHTPAEGSGILLFVFHANFLSEISARLCGPCSVHAVVLNDKFQLPIFLDSHFIYSFSPVPGQNKLFIRLAEAPTAKVKLLICAYRVQLQ